MKPSRLTIKIITLFPKFIEDFVENFGIIRKAVKKRLLKITPVYLRQFGIGKRGTVDDRPYGGGVGMILRADVLHRAIKFACRGRFRITPAKRRIILLTPQGKKFTQREARRLAKFDHLILICGRYEGFDERIRQFVDEEISIGDYVLMGGELPALVVSEAVLRLRPGILGKDESASNESFSDLVNITHGREGSVLLEYPQYTKPETLRVKDNKLGIKILKVPKVLLTGHHRKVEEWRKQEAFKRTKKRRPDLLLINHAN